MVTMDLKDFYLNTPMECPEFIQIKMLDMPDDVIQHYYLWSIVKMDGYVYCRDKKGMYGLPQAGILAQDLLDKDWPNMDIPKARSHQDYRRIPVDLQYSHW
jgi:hypothetical protein